MWGFQSKWEATDHMQGKTTVPLLCAFVWSEMFTLLNLKKEIHSYLLLTGTLLKSILLLTTMSFFSSTYSKYLLELHISKCVTRFENAWVLVLTLEPQHLHMVRILCSWEPQFSNHFDNNSNKALLVPPSSDGADTELLAVTGSLSFISSVVNIPQSRK